jgi:hypothetical protein
MTALSQLPARTTSSSTNSINGRLLHNKLTNTSVDPFPDFIGKLNAHFPTAGSAPLTNNPWPLT